MENLVLQYGNAETIVIENEVKAIRVPINPPKQIAFPNMEVIDIIEEKNEILERTDKMIKLKSGNMKNSENLISYIKSVNDSVIRSIHQSPKIFSIKSTLLEIEIERIFKSCISVENGKYYITIRNPNNSSINKGDILQCICSIKGVMICKTPSIYLDIVIYTSNIIKIDNNKSLIPQNLFNTEKEVDKEVVEKEVAGEEIVKEEVKEEFKEEFKEEIKEEVKEEVKEEEVKEVEEKIVEESTPIIKQDSESVVPFLSIEEEENQIKIENEIKELFDNNLDDKNIVSEIAEITGIADINTDSNTIDTNTTDSKVDKVDLQRIIATKTPDIPKEEPVKDTRKYDLGTFVECKKNGTWHKAKIIGIYLDQINSKILYQVLYEGGTTESGFDETYFRSITKINKKYENMKIIEDIDRHIKEAVESGNLEKTRSWTKIRSSLLR